MNQSSQTVSFLEVYNEYYNQECHDDYLPSFDNRAAAFCFLLIQALKDGKKMSSSRVSTSIIGLVSKLQENECLPKVVVPEASVVNNYVCQFLLTFIDLGFVRKSGAFYQATAKFATLDLKLVQSIFDCEETD